MIRDLETRFDRLIGILADEQGPKLRVGRFQGGGCSCRPVRRSGSTSIPRPAMCAG